MPEGQVANPPSLKETLGSAFNHLVGCAEGNRIAMGVPPVGVVEGIEHALSEALVGTSITPRVVVSQDPMRGGTNYSISFTYDAERQRDIIATEKALVASLVQARQRGLSMDRIAELAKTREVVAAPSQRVR